ncbi:hypothetical protein XELAEV_18012256mg [Xenopus laevis]|uniref:CCHC-type domain-containing protein n=1 Tax=Xenopus laevis TaxID=8355 RepID=A0A974HY34_XENLA|nr:hypothetical protein XELAEV_18012256mg [Xenopus laevis]
MFPAYQNLKYPLYSCYTAPRLLTTSHSPVAKPDRMIKPFNQEPAGDTSAVQSELQQSAEWLSSIKRYEGDDDSFHDLLDLCKFSMVPFVKEAPDNMKSKLIILFLLGGKALEWAEACVDEKAHFLEDPCSFLSFLKATFTGDLWPVASNLFSSKDSSSVKQTKPFQLTPPVPRFSNFCSKLQRPSTCQPVTTFSYEDSEVEDSFQVDCGNISDEEDLENFSIEEDCTDFSDEEDWEDVESDEDEIPTAFTTRFKGRKLPVPVPAPQKLPVPVPAPRKLPLSILMPALQSAAPGPALQSAAPVPALQSAALVPAVPSAALVPAVPSAAPVPAVPSAAPVPVVLSAAPVLWFGGFQCEKISKTLLLLALNRLLREDMITLYKSIRGHYRQIARDLFTHEKDHCIRGHPFRLEKNNIFLTVRLWNALPGVVVMADSDNAFNPLPAKHLREKAGTSCTAVMEAGHVLGKEDAILEAETSLCTAKGKLCPPSESCRESSRDSKKGKIPAKNQGTPPQMAPTATAASAEGGMEASMDCGYLAETVALQVLEEKSAGNKQTDFSLIVCVGEGVSTNETVAATDCVSKDFSGVSTSKDSVNEEDIVKALKTMEFLQQRKKELNNVIAKELSLAAKATGELRGQRIRKTAMYNKELEELEEEIKKTFLIIKPWEEIYKNRERFEQMEKGKSFSSNVSSNIPANNVVQPECVSGASGEREAVGQKKSQAPVNVWERRRLFANSSGVNRLLDGPVFKKRNAVRIKWEGERDKSPGWRYVARNLVKESMGFTTNDVNAFLDISDTEYDISFKLSQGLERFWSLYDQKKSTKEWENFRAIPISRPETKTVTIIFKHESVPYEDILVWLKRQCNVLTPLTKIYNEEGFWAGGWKTQVRLEVQHNVPRHLPNSFFIGRERGVCFYPGQPHQCFKCGSNRHLAINCETKVCALCGAKGHTSKECNEVRCNLCNTLGHTHRDCPNAWHNIVRDCPNLEQEFQEEGREHEEDMELETRVEGVVEPAVPQETRGNERKEKGTEEKGTKEDEWTVVTAKGNKQQGKMVIKESISTSNRFTLPGGKSWGEIAEEEERRINREEWDSEENKKSKKRRKSKEGQSPEPETGQTLNPEELTGKEQGKKRKESCPG